VKLVLRRVMPTVWTPVGIALPFTITECQAERY
jgi:hypothetical protein